MLRQFQGAEIGKVVRMRGSDWTVVGAFESGDAHDSELWTDINVARTTFGRTGSSSILAALDGADGLEKLKAGVAADPRLNVDVIRELDYFNGQTKQFRATIGFLAGIVTLIMALGAVFAALNSMYAAVAARGKEIATLRAIGFGGTAGAALGHDRGAAAGAQRRHPWRADRLRALQQHVGFDPGPELHAGGVQLQGHPGPGHPAGSSSPWSSAWSAASCRRMRAARLPVTTSLREQ